MLIMNKVLKKYRISPFSQGSKLKFYNAGKKLCPNKLEMKKKTKLMELNTVRFFFYFVISRDQRDQNETEV